MRWVIVAGLLAVNAAPALAADADRPMTNVPILGDMMQADAEQFVQKAMDSGMADMSLARLALTNSQNAQVKAFAEMMIKDHTAANDELKKIVIADKIPLSTKPDDKAKDVYEKLKNLKGADFDRAYMQEMIEDHDDAVDLFEDYSEDGDNTQLKQFAAKTLPTLRGHLDNAQAIEDTL
ncbi:MAG: DUF4142 domain-containing protein [Rhodospirillales bacterium]